MANTEMFQNNDIRPTQRKENKEIILKKIADEISVYEKEIDKIKKEAHKAVVLLYPNGKEILAVENKFDKEISKLEHELFKLTKAYDNDYIETTLPIYLYEKSNIELKENYEKAKDKINNDFKRNQRALKAKTVNRPQRDFEKELKELVAKHQLAVKSIKKSPDLGKIAIAEEVEFLEDKHQKNVEELTLKYQDEINEAKLTILKEEDIKPEMEALKHQKEELLANEKAIYEENHSKIVKPDKKSINIIVKEIKKHFKENKKELNIKIKTLLQEKKEAVAETKNIDLDSSLEKEIKEKTKQINKKTKIKIAKIKQEIKKIRGYRPRKLTYNRRKVLFGLVFLAPWIVGFVLLFAFPLVQSLYYSFFELTPSPGEIGFEFVGFDNYIYAFQEHVFGDSSFKIELLNTLQETFMNLIVLVIFSLFIAVLLNHEFRGRAIIRAIFFIPVILNSSAVSVALSQGGGLTELLLEESSAGVFNLGDYLMGMGLGTTLISFIVGLIGRIYDIITLSGVPILLFLAAIQSVPKHLYEAATIEGATGYEQFWLITLPNVSPHIITVSIYAIVDTFLTSSVSTIITTEFNKQEWGLSSAMSWVYVLMIIAILLVLAVVAKIFNIGDSHYEKEK